MPVEIVKSRGERWVFVAGACSTLVGVVVLAGWQLHQVVLIQIAPTLAPMQRNTAAGFIACGVGLLLSSRPGWLGKWGATGGAVFAGSLGGLTLIEYVFGLDLGIDQALGPAYVLVKVSHPGRMSPLTSICFVLVGFAMILSRGDQSSRAKSFALAFLSTAAGAIAGASLFSYFLGTSAAFGWTQVTWMAAHTAACFLVLNVSLVARAWALAMAARRGDESEVAPSWAPLCMGVGVSTVLLSLLQGVLGNETVKFDALHVFGMVGALAAILYFLAIIPMEFKHRIGAGLGIALAVLLFTGVFSYRTLVKSDESESRVRHTQLTLNVIEEVVGDMTSADAAYRGFMWTSDPLELDGWRQGAKNVRGKLAELRSLTADNANQQRVLFQAEPAIEGALADIQSRIEIQLQRGGPAGLAAFHQDRGWHSLQSVLTLLAEMRDEENRLLLQRSDDARAAARRARMVVIVGNSLAFLFLTAAGFIAGGEIRARARAESKFRGLLESAPDAIALVDPQGRIVLVNAQTERVFGFSRGELLNREIDDLIPQRIQDNNPHYRAGLSTLDQIAETGQGMEMRGVSKGGVQFPIEVRSSPIKTEKGALLSVAIRDITERKRGDEKLRRSEERFRLMESNVKDYAILMLDRDGHVVTWNAGAQKIKGYRAEEIIGQHFSKFYPPEDLKSGKPEYELEVVSKVGRFEDIGWRVRKDGSRFWANVVITALHDEKGELRGFGKVTRDITERKQAEEERHLQTQRLSLAAAVAKLGVWDWDVANNTVTWDETMFDIYGMKPVSQIAYHQWSAAVFPEDLPATEEILRRVVAEKGQGTAEFRINRTDGSHRNISAAESAILDENGAVVRVVGVNFDITERKRAQEEIELLNEGLEKRVAERTAELLEANGEMEAFTYSVAHDLRAPLRHMHGFVSILRQSWYEKIDDEGRRFLDKISKSANEMGLLLDDLLRFSHIGRQELKNNDVSLNDLVARIRLELESDVKGRALTWSISKLPDVEGDLALLHQVLFNLISNAVKYTRKSDPARIEIGSTTDAAENVTVFVRDNGAGFEMKYVDKLFRVFQRLHKPQDFEGTGIGLAIVRRIVERHGGRAWAEGAIGKGATFYISLPIKGQSNGQTRAHSAGR